MADELDPYSGPPLNTETWIEKGTPGDWLTGKGATGDVAHFTIVYDPRSEQQWVKEYAAGREDFQIPRIEAARAFFEENKPAEAIISARIAKEIPWRGGHFTFNSDPVIKALGLEDYVDEEHLRKLVQEGREDEIGVFKIISKRHAAMERAFSNPYEVKQELADIESQGRKIIKENEIEAWTDAVNFFGDSGDHHAAGVSANELGAAYEHEAKPEDALETFIAAGILIKYRLDEVLSRDNPGRQTAEVDVLSAHIIEAQTGVLRIMRTRDKIKGEDKELLKAAVYDLDDFGSRQAALEGYWLLAKSSRFGERSFYKKESRYIAGELSEDAFFEEHPNSFLMVKGGSGPRPNRRHLRPPFDLMA